MYSIWLQSLRKNWIILWSAWKRAKLCLESQRLFHHSAGTSITGLPVSSTLYAYVIHLRFLSYKGEALSVDYRLSTAMQIYLCAMLFLSIVLFSHFGCYFNPLMGTGNYSAHRIIWSWYTGRWWVGCYIWYSEEGPGRAGAQSPPRCTKCNSPPINGQCTNFILFDVHCNCLCPFKG